MNKKKVGWFCSKNIIWIFFQRNIRERKTFSRSTCVEDRVRDLKALLTITAFRDVVERVKSMCIHLSLISAVGHPLHQAVSLLFSVFFFKKKRLYVSFLKIFLFLSLTLFSNYQVFSFFENYLLHLFFKKIIAQKPLLLLFISLLLLSCFLSSFFRSSCFVKGIWWQRTMHVIKRNEWTQWVWMVTKVWKGGLMLARFWAWQSTKGNVLADNFRLGLAAIVCFLWLSDLCVTQTARGTSTSECLS